MPGRASRTRKPAGGSGSGGGSGGRGGGAAGGGRRGGRGLTTTTTTTSNATDDDDDRDHADADIMDASNRVIVSSGRVKLEDGHLHHEIINKNGGGGDVASSIAIPIQPSSMMAMASKIGKDFVVDANNNANKVIYPRRNLPLLLLQHQEQRCHSSSGDDVGNTNHNTSMPSSSSSLPLVGYVRATPPGHLLDQRRQHHHHHHPHETTQNQPHPTQSPVVLLQKDDAATCIESWTRIRSDPLKTGTFPKEGFDHILGTHEIRQVDGIPIGGRIVELDGPYPTATSSFTTDRRTIDNYHNINNSTTTTDAGLDEVLLDGNDKVVRHDTKKKKPIQSSPGATTGGEYFLEPEEEAALQAELAQRRMALARMENIDDDDGGGGGSGGGANHDASDGHEYGASRTPLDAPIGSLREKWRVLPHFLKLRGLMKQHIDSFDHFVSVEMKQIVQVS